MNNEIPVNQLIILHFDKHPIPLLGQKRQDFGNKIVLALPCFEVRPDEDADEDDKRLFDAHPDEWLCEATGNQLDLVNSCVNINPDLISLVLPPKSWTLIHWSYMGPTIRDQPQKATITYPEYSPTPL